ncbi:Uncharacterised protein [Achromobacter spanius]|nr:hypothetical protein LMG5911_03514 [Achromobacter spanius]SPT40732.1 Uncharacterised protein [Achromobacter denitrificans]VEE59040.1 Uncharacterised protein [Achromobacter spanius]
MPVGSSLVRACWGGAVFAPFGGAAFAAFAGRGRDIGFSGEYCVAVGLTISIASDPRKRLAVIKHAFAIQVVIAGDALKFGDGCRGRGVAHNTVQRAIRRTYEYVGKSPGKRDDDLHGRSHDRHCSPMATRRDLGFPLDCCASSFLLDVGRKDLHKCSPGVCKVHGYAKAAASTRGITSAAAPCRLQCAWASSGVTFGFTCTTVAPAASARCGSSAAG